MHKIVNKMTQYENISRIVIYTNATIVPKGEQLECLKNKKHSKHTKKNSSPKTKR